RYSSPRFSQTGMEFNRTPSTSKITPLIIDHHPLHIRASLTSAALSQHLFHPLFQFSCCRLDILLCKDRADHGNSADPAASELHYILPADPADRNNRDVHSPADLLQSLTAHFHRVGLRSGWEHSAYSEVVSALLLSSERLFHRLGRHTDNLLRTQLSADVSC